MAPPQGHDPVAYAGVAVIALIIYYLVTLMFKLDSDSKVKTAPGGILQTMQTMTSRDFPSLILKLHKEVDCDPLFQLNMPVPGGLYVLANADMQKEVLRDPGTDKPSIVYDDVKKIAGHYGIFTHKASNPRWKHLRKGSSPAFSSSEVGRMNSIATKHINQWMETVLNPIIDKPDSTFDPCHEMTKVAFRLILEAGFEYQPIDQEFDDFINNLSAALIELGLKQPHNPLRGVFGFMIPEVRYAMACCKDLQAFAYKILQAYRDNKNKSESNTLIKLIENNPHDLTDQEKMAEIVTYMIAGHDTTGNTLGMTLILLAKHQDIHTKVFESLPKHATVPSEYLAHVLQESKRLMPTTALGTIRIVSRDFDFGDGMILPKKSNVIMPQVLAHHNSTIFDRPDEFLPERWENASKTMISNMLIFGHGNRNCIGQSLAQAELNTVLPVLLSNYRFEIVDEGKPDFFATLKFAGAKLRVSKA